MGCDYNISYISTVYILVNVSCMQLVNARLVQKKLIILPKSRRVDVVKEMCDNVAENLKFINKRLQAMPIPSVWKNELSVGMLVLDQKHILNAIIKICIEMRESVDFLSVRFRFDQTFNNNNKF